MLKTVGTRGSFVRNRSEWICLLSLDAKK